MESVVATVARFVPLTANGSGFIGKCPLHNDEGKSLRVDEKSWRCLGCGGHDNGQGDGIGWLMAWSQCSREEAEHQLSNGGLPEPIPVQIPPKLKLPFWGGWALDKYPDARVWIHDNGESGVHGGREFFPERVHLGLITGAPLDDVSQLTEPKKRECILLPRNVESSLERMDALAAALYAAGHAKVKWIDPRSQEDNWSWPLGMGKDEAVAFAKKNVRTYPQINAASQGGLPARMTGYVGGLDSRTTSVESGPTATRQQDEPSLANPATAAPSNAAPDPATVSPSSSQGLDRGAASDSVASALGTPPAPDPDDPGPVAPPGTPKARKTPPDLNLVDETGALRKPRIELANDPEQLPAFSEFALATAFAETTGKDWRFTAAWLEWAKWNGVRWVPDEVKRITWEMRECCTAVMNAHTSDSTPLQRMRLTTLKTVNAVMALAGSDPAIAAAAAQWDANPMLLGTPSGIVDLSTGALITATREQMISRSTGISPCAGGHPWWDRVLERAGIGMGRFLQLWCGYMLTGDTREERFLFIHGPGGGGKSKFMLVLSEILGDYRRTTKMESFTAQSRQEHSEEIARLAGARLVIATETDEGSRWNEARIKALTGRDAIAARHMHKSTFEFKPQFKLVFVGNHRPALRSVGEEMRRRIDLVEWGATIPQEERILDLPDKLRAEYPTILAWMIEGCLLWQKEGLTKPESVKVSVADYIQGEDTLGAWLEECTNLEQGERTRNSFAYANYKRWAESRGEYVLSQKRFTQALRDRGFAIIKSMGFPHFIDMQLKSNADARDDDYIHESASWVPPDR